MREAASPRKIDFTKRSNPKRPAAVMFDNQTNKIPKPDWWWLQFFHSTADVLIRLEKRLSEKRDPDFGIDIDTDWERNKTDTPWTERLAWHCAVYGTISALG